MGLWDAKPWDILFRGWMGTEWGEAPWDHPSVFHFSGPGETGLGMEAEPRQLFRMLLFGMPLAFQCCPSAL